MTTKLHPKRQLSDQVQAPKQGEEDDVDVIRCQDCGATYPAVDGPALLYSLKSPCLHCGGECELTAIDDGLRQVA
jgi:hypothetical protein